MMNQKTQNKESDLLRISNILLINGGFLNNPGLFYGEMSIVLFFSHYSRFSQNELYLKYSFDLIERIQKSIYIETPINYKDGLAGIGSSIEYLAQNGFFEADIDDILEDYDDLLFSNERQHSLTLEEIMSIGYYSLWRILGNSSKKEDIRRNILPGIVNLMERKCNNFNSISPMVSFLKNILSDEILISSTDPLFISGWKKLCNKIKAKCLNKEISDGLGGQSLNNAFFSNSDLGLGVLNGLSGLGLSLLTELDGDDSWTLLFPDVLIS